MSDESERKRTVCRAAAALVLALALLVSGCGKRQAIDSIISPGSPRIQMIVDLDRSAMVFDSILSARGAALREDADRLLYGKSLNNRQVVERRVKPPKAAALLMSVLKKYSPREGVVKGDRGKAARAAMDD